MLLPFRRFRNLTDVFGFGNFFIEQLSAQFLMLDGQVEAFHLNGGGCIGDGSAGGHR